MTYQEALEQKLLYGHSIIENNLEHLVLIVPKKQEDFIKFLSNYKESKYTDEDCKKYSSDNQYQLHKYMSEKSRSLLS